jgi:hypothetical protein
MKDAVTRGRTSHHGARDCFREMIGKEVCNVHRELDTQMRRPLIACAVQAGSSRRAR